MGALQMGACDLLGAGMVCGFPILCLLRARSAARAGRLARAEYLARVARLCSWVLLGIFGVPAIGFLATGYPLWRHPVEVAWFSAPVPIWFWSRSLYASIRARREAGAAPAPPVDPPR